MLNSDFALLFEDALGSCLDESDVLDRDNCEKAITYDLAKMYAEVTVVAVREAFQHLNSPSTECHQVDGGLLAAVLEDDINWIFPTEAPGMRPRLFIHADFPFLFIGLDNKFSMLSISDVFTGDV